MSSTTNQPTAVRPVGGCHCPAGPPAPAAKTTVLATDKEGRTARPRTVLQPHQSAYEQNRQRGTHYIRRIRIAGAGSAVPTNSQQVARGEMH